MTEPAQIKQALQLAEARFGVIDVLVNDASYGVRAALKEADEAW